MLTDSLVDTQTWQQQHKHWTWMFVNDKTSLELVPLCNTSMACGTFNEKQPDKTSKTNKTIQRNVKVDH